MYVSLQPPSFMLSTISLMPFAMEVVGSTPSGLYVEVSAKWLLPSAT